MCIMGLSQVLYFLTMAELKLKNNKILCEAPGANNLIFRIFWLSVH